MQDTSNERTVKGRWYETMWCEHCDHRLSWSDVFETRAVCPYCGHASYAHCVYRRRVFREVKHQRRFLWFFWRTVEVTYEEKGHGDARFT